MKKRYIIPSKEEGTVHISVDALFGCVRKISSGESSALPKHGETFFISQDNVDAFISSYGKKNDAKLEVVSELQINLKI